MFGFSKITVKKNEHAVLLRNGDFDRLLQPGKHWLFSGVDKLRVECFALEQVTFTHGLADYFMAKEPALVAQEFVQAALTDTQVGLRYDNGVLAEVLAPGTRKLFWKGLNEVRIDVVDISESEKLPADLVAKLGQNQLRQRPVVGLQSVLLAQVPEFHAGLLTVDGQVRELLKAGAYGFWRFNRQV
jgi:hypothetical protein